MNLIVTWLTSSPNIHTDHSWISTRRKAMPTNLDRPPVQEPRRRRDRTHWLYIAVIVAGLAVVAVGLLAPDVGKSVALLGTMFVSLIKMMIAPVIFCTIV